MKLTLFILLFFFSFFFSTFDNLPVHWCLDVFSNVFLDKLKEVSKEILELVSIRMYCMRMAFTKIPLNNVPFRKCLFYSSDYISQDDYIILELNSA